MLLWLWCRPAAVAPIRPLAWEPLYASGVALKKKKKKKKFQTLEKHNLDFFGKKLSLNGCLASMITIYDVTLSFLPSLWH